MHLIGLKSALKRPTYYVSPETPGNKFCKFNGHALHLVETFKCFGIVFTTDGRQTKEIDTFVRKAEAVLRVPYSWPVTKWESSNTAKLAV